MLSVYLRSRSAAISSPASSRPGSSLPSSATHTSSMIYPYPPRHLLTILSPPNPLSIESSSYHRRSVTGKPGRNSSRSDCCSSKPINRPLSIDGGRGCSGVSSVDHHALNSADEPYRTSPACSAAIPCSIHLSGCFLLDHAESPEAPEPPDWPFRGPRKGIAVRTARKIYVARCVRQSATASCS